MSTFEKDREVALAVERRERNLNVLRAWLQKAHPEIKPCMSNDKVFSEYFDQSWSDTELSDADFEFALENMDTTLATQYVPTPEEVVAAENKHRKKLSLPELRDLSRRESPPPYQRSLLPTEWTPPGKKRAVDISTPAALKALAKNDYPAFKALTARFGSSAINERLGVKSTTQPGQSVTLTI